MTGTGKKVLAVVVAAAAVAAGIFGYRALKGGEGSADNAVYVQMVRNVNMANNGYSNRYSGIVETQQTEKITFDTSRKLDELLVAEGQSVKSGDIIFKYSTEDVDLQIQQAELEVEQMNTNISDSNAQIEELQKAMNRASASDIPAYSAQIKDLQAQVAQTEYNVKTKQAEIEKLKSSKENAGVACTLDGTVKSIADLEALINGTLTEPDGSMSTTYVTIVAEGDYRVKGTVTEQTIGEIYIGAPVILRSRIDTSVTWSGTITDIDTDPSSSQSSMDYGYSGESASQYAFYADLDTTEGLMLGQHLTIEMDYGQSASKTGIWLNSGFVVNEGGSDYVWAAKESGAKLEKRSVTLGEYDEELDEVEIASGLDETEYIAWPDESCKAGAPTTSEMILPDEGEYYEEGGEYYEEGDELLEGESGFFEEDNADLEEDGGPVEEVPESNGHGSGWDPAAEGAFL
ncbi:MAG: efflux RND transporter periplasmic adaptor subunit [Lachnospiraceae bacterium]|nr:efflux RND transporter periplasmic adaptor subunit [Lachnospiraceae bacterium]